jgi:hypothetical protein
MKLEFSNGIYNSVKVGDLVICCDNIQFIVVEMPDKEFGLLNIKTSKINHKFESIVDIINYINEYHMGIHRVINNDDVIIKEPW